ncbi:SpoIIE family protein phosphatase, partial [Streptomyces sp. NPDC059853]|uniref:PP2C family protein-serine/threonine phosphatase n=1 Tax=Streptomyces sp. NPDC059853 TaxID=3346973 RepID=UPI003659A7BD
MLSSPHSESSANNLPAGSDAFATFDDVGSADPFDALLARARRLREDARALRRAERSPLRRAAWDAATDRLDEFGRQVAELRPVPAEPDPAAAPAAPGRPGAGIGSAEWNLLTDGVVWSDELFAIFGRPVADGPLTLDQLPSCLVAEDQPVLAAAMTGCLVDGRPMDCEVRVNRPDGTRRTVRMAGEPVLDERGGTVAMWAVIRDIGGPGGARDHPAGEPRPERRPAPAGLRQTAGLPEPALRGPAPRQAGFRTVPAQRGRSGSLELAARCLPAGDGGTPGGTWYDSLELADGTGVLSLGDLPGQGAEVPGPAGALGAVRGIALTGAGPGDLLGHLNELLDRGSEPLLASAVCCRYQPDERLLTWAQAGHPAPLLCRGGSGRALARPAGPLLGTVTGAVYAERMERLEPGDVLVLHTDGLFSDSRAGAAPAGHDGDRRLLALAGRLALAGSAAEC